MRCSTLRIALLGDDKTAWIDSLGGRNKDGVVEMRTPNGPFCFDIRELASLHIESPRIISKVDYKLVGFDAVIIMDDTYHPRCDVYTIEYLTEVCKYLPGLPVYFVTDKETATPHESSDIGCFPRFFVNTKTGLNVEKPLLVIAREATANDTLEFLPAKDSIIRIEIDDAKRLITIARHLVDLLNSLVTTTGDK